MKNTTYDLLQKHNISAKKKFGQNFLTDDNILRKIANAKPITSETLVIEIGPGLGSLTKYLVEKAKAVIAYEIDDDLIPLLNDAFKSDRFHLIHDDILKRDIDKDILAVEPSPKEVVVIANLPYYITTPILMQCIEQSTLITNMVVMMQYEVGKRISAVKNTKDYNALSLAIQYRAKTRFAFKVPRTVFVPAPNVDSAVITLDFHDHYAKQTNDESLFFELIKAAFKQRRKTLLNNLHEYLGESKETIVAFLDGLGINPTARAESLDIDTFIKLSNALQKDKNS